MEFFVVSVGILLPLIVVGAVMDLRARRSGRRLRVDPTGVREARRINQARGDLYKQGHDAGRGV